MYLLTIYHYIINTSLYPFPPPPSSQPLHSGRDGVCESQRHVLRCDASYPAGRSNWVAHGPPDMMLMQSATQIYRLSTFSVLDQLSVGTHPRLVETTMLAADAEGLDGRRRLLRHQQSLLQLDLLLQLHQHRRLHAVPEKHGTV